MGGSGVHLGRVWVENNELPLVGAKSSNGDPGSRKRNESTKKDFEFGSPLNLVTTIEHRLKQSKNKHSAAINRPFDMILDSNFWIFYR